MARILLTAPGNRPWSIGPYLVRGLRALGHEVELFDYRSTDDLEDDLFGLLDSFKPQAHVLYKGETVTPAMVGQIGDLGVYTILWHDDIDPHMPEWLVELVRAHDAFFTPAYGMVDEFKAIGIERVAYLSGAFDPEAHRYDSMTDAEREKYTSDVVFVGRIVNHRVYHERIDMIRRVIEAGVSIKWWGFHIPRKLRTASLILSKVGRAYGGAVAYGGLYAKITHSTRISLGYDVFPHIERGICNRAYVTCGLGGFYLTRHVVGIEALFEPDREIVTFADLDEMADKVAYYLAHDDERQRIAAAGQQRVLRDHTYTRRFQAMLDAIRDWDGPDLTQSRAGRAGS